MNTEILTPLFPSDVPAPLFNLFDTVNYCDEDTGTPCAGIIVGAKYTSLIEALGEGLMFENERLLPTLCLGWHYTISRYQSSTPEEILDHFHHQRWRVEVFHESQLWRLT